MKVLIFGLPGSGKTRLATDLLALLGDRAEWHNADAIRKECDDWDFSEAGRERQLQRMRILAQKTTDKGKIALCDFICPLEEYRELFDADYQIWVNTIEEGEYDDTNKLFQAPTQVPNYVVTEHRADLDARTIMWDLIGDNFDVRAPTAQMLGRFQPWHDGHQALFERLLDKEGQVALMVRDMEPDENNLHHVLDICEYLQFQLAEYADRVRIYAAPNITRIGYGRDVGYKIEQEHFDENIEKISATEIRQKSK